MSLFGKAARPEPQDHLLPKKTERERTADLDMRRQAQIANQIESINRLLKDGTYGKEMEALHLSLAEMRVLFTGMRNGIEALTRTVKNQLILDQLQKLLKAAEEQGPIDE